ncbi:hypothetical protein HPB51_013682 [Rhipicephalus microplus]|uniref:5'-Nucleotidase C-terminal domain-containing protein n=1 Tax=Rhipicephalus microplus TaxID=6941 RepID=A0A9J6F2K4_RHIMP|nr:hypothetical protein HPB51_013682 [Rhipicephalus microplus]
MAEVIGSTRVLMEHKDDICRLQECNLGNLIADAFFDYYVNLKMAQPPAWSDINGALVNAGGIRTSLPSFYFVAKGGDGFKFSNSVTVSDVAEEESLAIRAVCCA